MGRINSNVLLLTNLLLINMWVA